MGQIIGSFPVLIISDPCHPREPDWYSISCVSCWFTELCSCYLPYWGFLQKQKYKSECTFPSNGRAFQRLGLLARKLCGQRARYSRSRQWNSPTKSHQRLVIIKEDQHVTAILLRQSRKFHIFRTICGQWRSIVKEQWCSFLSFSSDGNRCFSSSSLSAFQCQFATSYYTTTPYLKSKVLFLTLEWRNFPYKPDSSWLLSSNFACTFGSAITKSGTKLRWTFSHDGTLEGSYTKSHIIYNLKLNPITARLFDYQTVGQHRPKKSDDQLDSLRPTVYILDTFKKKGRGL